MISLIKNKKAIGEDLILSLVILGGLLFILLIYPKSCLSEETGAPSSKYYSTKANHVMLNDELQRFLVLSIEDADPDYISLDIKKQTKYSEKIKSYKSSDYQMIDLVKDYILKEEEIDETILKDIITSYINKKIQENQLPGKIYLYICKIQETGELDCDIFYNPESFGQILKGIIFGRSYTFYALGEQTIPILKESKESDYIILLEVKG